MCILCAKDKKTVECTKCNKLLYCSKVCRNKDYLNHNRFICPKGERDCCFRCRTPILTPAHGRLIQNQKGDTHITCLKCLDDLQTLSNRYARGDGTVADADII